MRRASSIAMVTGAAIWLGALDGVVHAAAPSFSCKRPANTVEKMICNDDDLAALDRKLADVYGTATKTPSQYADLNTQQRAWVAARNDCWKASDFRACIETTYTRRIAALQAMYKLVRSRGPYRYACANRQSEELVATFFETSPPSVALGSGQDLVVAYLVRSGADAQYEGVEVKFRERQGGVTVSWLRGTPEFDCALTK